MGFTIFGIQFGSPAEPDYPGPVQCPDTKAQYGLPLTISEAGRLADSLALVDQLARVKVGGHAPGMPWVRSLADQVAEYVGGAKIREYTYVPVPLSALDTATRALHAGLDMEPHSDELRVFQRLVQRMHVLAGMAKMAGWVLNPAANGSAWMNAEPSRELLGHGEGGEVEYID